MARDLTVFVDCVRGNEIIRTYDFLVPATLAGPPIPDPDKLIMEAKTNLTNEHLATPPYDGINFNIRS
jgi:hypothetical protein